MLVLIIALAGTCYHQPFYHREFNHFELISLSTSCLVFYLGQVGTCFVSNALHTLIHIVLLLCLQFTLLDDYTNSATYATWIAVAVMILYFFVVVWFCIAILFPECLQCRRKQVTEDFARAGALQDDAPATPISEVKVAESTATSVDEVKVVESSARVNVVSNKVAPAAASVELREFVPANSKWAASRRTESKVVTGYGLDLAGYLKFYKVQIKLAKQQFPNEQVLLFFCHLLFNQYPYILICGKAFYILDLIKRCFFPEVFKRC